MNNCSFIGEMEKTMVIRFCMGQNLRSLFHEQQLPPSIFALISQYEQTYHADIRGTLINDDLSFDTNFQQLPEKDTWETSDESRLPRPVFRLLRHWVEEHDREADIGPLSTNAFGRRKIGRLGETFQIPEASVGDSKILIHDGNAEMGWAAATVKSIFSHNRTKNGRRIAQTFLVVQRYVPLTDVDARMDNFRKHSIVAGRLFYHKLDKSEVLITVDDIISHFGSRELMIEGISEPCILALPLDRVSISLIYLCSVLMIRTRSNAKPFSIQPPTRFFLVQFTILSLCEIIIK